MAKKIWEEPIDKNVDWGGDASTNNLPVSGQMVQKFIKDGLDSKAGIFHYDTANNRYIVFSDTIARDEYLSDPTKTHLIIGTFDAPFNYTATINLTSKAYNAVFLNSTGNYIDFTFDVVNKQGASTGENVTVTYTIIRNANKQVITETKKFGDVVHFNIDKYLGEGTNTIMVGITGQTSLAATTVAITYQVINLKLTDELNIAKYFNLTSGEQQLEVGFTLSGYGTKIVEWYIDGELLPFIKSEDEVVDVSASRTKYITLSNLSQGTHSLQIRAYTVINGEQFYTDTLYRDLLVYNNNGKDVIIGIATTIPREYGVLSKDDSVSLYNIVQYVPYTLRFATYSPLNAANTEVKIVLDGVLLGTVGSKNDTENTFVITPSTSGNKKLRLEAGNVVKEFDINVQKTSMNIQEIDGAIIDFIATGKSNTSADRDVWTDGIHTGVLTGFNWNNSSGWVNGRLEMNAGTSFAIDYAPLSGDPISTGKTIEIEWSTKNVTNDNAIICDLRGENGVGILITATKVSMISADGVTVETEYKSDENVRIGFVINKARGVTNRRLSFIYTNGIVSRAEQWATTDNYNSDTTILFTATEEAELSLKHIRIYDTALSSDNMLNNYILYRDTIAEMMEIYDRNDIYESGTTTFSPEKMMSRLPVMIVTGDIPTLENTSDKNEQIVVDIEYYNMQDSSRNFTMKNAAMRPQGTSSMGYPKKNFRIYTQKVANTELYDADGNLVEDKLYSFKDKAQPVNCWCLKADYAESSGTHNTGIAKLWNTALYNAHIDGEYKLRTNAQKKALENSYNYDVRTTIDGFPILLFYRPQYNDDLIFIGKYNFNNDKSTEKVFGFTDIPGFDNSRMQCWEILNNGNALALFTSVSNFDKDWGEAFESRYPDTKTPYLGDLKAFCTWMTNVSASDFATQKWEHLDVYKMAAYWIYLMRHAAADQFAKNAMLTSEDGKLFYFIHYDNDTINGLINTGHLRLKPTDDRQTKDATGSYVFAGHDSRLWNLLEADEEFKNIVSVVDNALYTAGISYANTIKVFDDDQADKWVEKVYNQDAQYKYIGPYVEKGINNLFMLQGKRDLHRKWWLAKRFSIYDAKYVSGSYKSQAIEIKCLNGTEVGQKFSIKAGYPLDYGYGINNIPRSFGITLNVGDYHEFTTQEVINIGDPVRIYGAPNISEIDFSKMSDRLAVVTIANVYDENLGTKLTKLILGNPNKVNAEVAEISGLKQATALEELDIQGLSRLNSVDLSNHQYFRKLKAFGSGISSATFAKGAPIERIEMPESLRSLTLNQLPYLTTDNIIFERYYNLQNIEIIECPNVSNNFDFIYNWYTNKDNQNGVCSVVIDSVVWDNVDAREFIDLMSIRSDGGILDLKGWVSIPNATLEDIYSIRDVFGETVFYPDAEFYIEVPTILGIKTDTNSILEGENLQAVGEVYPLQQGSYSYSITKGREGCSIDPNTGYITTQEVSLDTSTITIKADFVSNDGTTKLTTEKDIQVLRRTYPSEVVICGESDPLIDNNYRFEIINTGINGEYHTKWVLEGDITTFFEIDNPDTNNILLKQIEPPIIRKEGVLHLLVIRNYDKTIVLDSTLSLSTIIPNVVINYIDNAPIQAALYNAGLVNNEKYSLKSEVEAITASQLQSGNSAATSIFNGQSSNITSFDEFRYFTNLTSVPAYLFQGCTKMTSITLPNTVKIVEVGAFYLCRGLTSIDLTGVVSIARMGFVHCSGLTSVILSDSLTTLASESFRGCTSLTNIYIPASVTSIDSNAFHQCTRLNINVNENNGTYASYDGMLLNKSMTSVLMYVKDASQPHCVVPEEVTTLSASVFASKVIESIVLPSTLTRIDNYAFMGCSKLTTIKISALTAPTLGIGVFGSSSSNYTGTNTSGDGINKLYISFGATGYESGLWLDPLQNTSKCGFSTHGKLTIVSNKSNAQFDVKYTTEANTSKTVTVGVGTCYLNDIKYGTNMTVTPNAISGYTWQEDSKTITYNGETAIDINAYIYPSSVAISGNTMIQGSNSETYTADITPSNIDVGVTYAWSLSPSSNASISQSGNQCTITTNTIEAEETLTLTCVVKSIDNKVTLQDVRSVTLMSRPNFITATYNVTSTSSATELVNIYFNVPDITYMEIDGVEVTPSLSYTFSSTGIHTVKLSVETIVSLFSSVNTLTSVDFSECDGAKYTSARLLFQSCPALTTINWGECIFPNVTSISSLIRNGNLETIDLSPFKDAPITDISYMCFGCKKLKDINLGVLQNAVIEEISNAFYNCEVITSIDFSKLQFGSVVLLSSVFYGCKSLLSIDWGDNTFRGCTKIDSLFHNCASLTSIDLSPLEGSKASGTGLSHTFFGCTSLTSIDLSPLINCTLNSNSTSIFSGCDNLKTIIAPWAIAPTVGSSTFGNKTSNYTGRNTYSTGENMLYVPTGATGYDSGYWLDPLQNASKCGFTLSATL